MRRIVRLTLVYSTYEDRLQWRVVDGEGVTLRLWLTQRLCNMLVKAVLNVLDKTVEPAPLPAEQANVPVSSPHGAALPQAKNQTHYWEQTMADMAKAPAQTVEAPEDTTPQVLIDALRLGQIKETYVINFDWGDETIAMPLAAVELRQLMRVLYNRYTAAGWPRTGLWPDWFRDDAHRQYVKESQIN